ncbi:unnamed protein product [Strongylus vulgaris]|uniref:Uncharacterized protein n=1 Tax=Strongylus vulgaris TaxID=40348 RepID=A0A3P7JII7_STRVU|nr:unnamed protein product [Strongylus vulgaris]
MAVWEGREYSAAHEDWWTGTKQGANVDEFVIARIPRGNGKCQRFPMFFFPLSFIAKNTMIECRNIFFPCDNHTSFTMVCGP